MVLREGEFVEIGQLVSSSRSSTLDAAVVPEVVTGTGSREEGELVVC
jgi:hypothetical protein